MTENAIITAASLIGAGLVCLGAANGAGVPLPRRAAGRQARHDRHARLEVRHLRRPEVGGPAGGGPELCGIRGAGDRLPYHLCVCGTGKRFHHHSVRRKSDAVCRIRVDRVGRCPLLAVSPLPDHFKSIEGSFRGCRVLPVGPVQPGFLSLAAHSL